MSYYSDYEIEMYENTILELDEFKSSFKGEWKNVDASDIQIGDFIYVDYIPDSQNYIYQLVPKFGTVSEIEDNDSHSSPHELEIFDHISVLNKHGKQKISYGFLHMYGMSRSYSYSIYKFFKSSE
jgi:hypothetical protein